MAQTKNLSIEGVAHYFGVAPSTVYRLAQRGLLPGFKIGGQWRFSERILEAWIVDQVAHTHHPAASTTLVDGEPPRHRRKPRRRGMEAD